jgi:hypothetical protein
MEVRTMMKKVMIAVVALMFAAVLAAPSKANAQVVFRLGVGPLVVGNAPVVVAPAPVMVAPAPYVAYGPGYVYPPVVYPGNVVVGVGYARPYGYRYGGGRGYGWRR